ncbi:RHS repeat protein [Pseudomonas aeruginosa]|nr:RHS repeat protein [Pseudomonas aeruginosa]
MTRLVSPDSGTTTFEHDAAGNVIRRTDARGAVTEYRYDALNRLIERHSPSDPSLDVQYATTSPPTATKASAAWEPSKVPATAWCTATTSAATWSSRYAASASTSRPCSTA